MSLTWFSLDVDSADPPKLARCWADVLGYDLVWEEDAYVAIATAVRTFRGMIFNRVHGAKTTRTDSTSTSTQTIKNPR
ncbi:MAG TPA: hypothetical protein VHM94_16840 [Acidimicrobiia bacterium]|nr:hypothetical protein [Acidimicrobiia bacterium]